MADLKMPRLGADMEAGRLIEWRIKPGDAIKRGDIAAIIETEKATLELEVWHHGVVVELLVHEGGKVPVGTVLARVRGEGEALEPAATAALPSAPRPQRVSPAARKLAEIEGVDLALVSGTGPNGAIARADVEAYLRARLPKPAASPEEEKTKAMRRTIAAAMTRSNREIPHYYLGVVVDLGPALSWLADENLRRPVSGRLLPAALFVKGVSVAARAASSLNGFYLEQGFVASSAVHVGVAISLRRGGLVAPAIHDVDNKTVGEVMTALQDLTRRARAGTLRASELSDPTITLTVLGDQGAEAVHGVIYPPQVALVGVGRIVLRPLCVDGQVVARPSAHVTLSADHRASDGHDGSRFLLELQRYLEHPGAHVP